jgi:hypothetical protein
MVSNNNKSSSTFLPPLKYDAVDLGRVRFGKPFGKDRKMIPVQYELEDGTLRSLEFQTPSNMHVPYGVSYFHNEKTGDLEGVSLNLSFGNMDASNACDAPFMTLFKLVQGLETMAVEAFAKYDSEVSGAPLKDVSGYLSFGVFKSAIKSSSDPEKAAKYAKTFKIKLPYDFRANKFDGRVWNTDQTESTLDALVKGSKVSAVVSVPFLWTIGTSSCGLSFRGSQIRLDSAPQVSLSRAPYAMLSCDNEPASYSKHDDVAMAEGGDGGEYVDY